MAGLTHGDRLNMLNKLVGQDITVCNVDAMAGYRQLTLGQTIPASHWYVSGDRISVGGARFYPYRFTHPSIEIAKRMVLNG